MRSPSSIKNKIFMKTLDFTKWLEKFINFERWPQKNILNLKSMLFFADTFGNPQNDYKTVHIAGSKGKGSLSIMISSILKEADLKVGLYMSPHVIDFRERVTLAGEFFPDEVYSLEYDKIKKGFEALIAKDSTLDPTWFEIVTMLSFLLFKDEKCDWGVFETGMGGRLDTTNILDPVCSVLTPIELEHCQYLGDTKEKIAFEKAGIIKKNKPVFCFEQETGVLNVFKEKAKEMSSSLYYLPSIIKAPIKTEVHPDGLKIEIDFNKDDEIGSLFSRSIKTTLSFIDTIQAKNAALAAVVCKYLLPDITEEKIEKGLQRAWLPARFEIISKKPLIIVDGAHTEKSIGYSVDTYKKLTNQKCIVLFACADDKDTHAIAPLFKDIAKKIVITIPGTFKKSNIEKTTKDFQEFYNGAVEIESSPKYENVIQDCLDQSRKEDCPLLITGSFYLVSEVKKIIAH